MHRRQIIDGKYHLTMCIAKLKFLLRLPETTKPPVENAKWIEVKINKLHTLYSNNDQTQIINMNANDDVDELFFVN